MLFVVMLFGVQELRVAGWRIVPRSILLLFCLIPFRVCVNLLLWKTLGILGKNLAFSWNPKIRIFKILQRVSREKLTILKKNKQLSCPAGLSMTPSCPYFGPFMIPDCTIYGFRLDHRSLWFQADHTLNLNHIWFQIDHGKIREKMHDLYGIIFDQSMINPVGKPGLVKTLRNKTEVAKTFKRVLHSLTEILCFTFRYLCLIKKRWKLDGLPQRHWPF